MDPGPCFVYVPSKIDALNFEFGSLKSKVGSRNSEVRSRKSFLGIRSWPCREEGETWWYAGPSGEEGVPCPCLVPFSLG